MCDVTKLRCGSAIAVYTDKKRRKEKKKVFLKVRVLWESIELYITRNGATAEVVATHGLSLMSMYIIYNAYKFSSRGNDAELRSLAS